MPQWPKVLQYFCPPLRTEDTRSSARSQTLAQHAGDHSELLRTASVLSRTRQNEEANGSEPSGCTAVGTSTEAPAFTPIPAPAEALAVPEHTEKAGPTHRITVEVDPMIALTAIGLAKGYFLSIVEHIESQSGLRMDEMRKQQMLDTLNEIYERCIEKTDVREVAYLYLRSELSGKFS